MLCLRCRALPAVRPSMPSRSLNRTTQGASQNSPITPIISSRSFSSTLFSTPTHLLQPTPQISTSSHIMSSRLPSTAIPSVSSSLSLSPVTSLLQSQSRAFSSTPTLGVRRSTYNPSRRVQKRRHGFLSRSKTKNGRKVIQRRRLKGRKNMSW